MTTLATTMKTTLGLLLAAAAFATAAQAQQAEATKGAAILSEPGKAMAVRIAKISAQVVGIDKDARIVTLKGPKGNVVDVVAGNEVKNFAQIKLGDVVVARYVEAISLELKKNAGEAGDVSVAHAAAQAKPGATPAAGMARQVTVFAEVVAVDPAKSEIALKGPRGNVVTLAVQNPDQFKVVKLGDLVQATYTEAFALSLEPAATGQP